MTPPIIGITTSRDISRNGYPFNSASEAYIQSVSQAGGAPLLIPLGLPEESLSAILSRLDGLLFTGGGDVRPERYGSQPHPLVSGVDEDRDRVELYLFNKAHEAGKPFMGICRGFQVINVALGGTLYEDIADQRPNSLVHPNGNKSRSFLAHSVNVEVGTRLARILGSQSVQVNSLHHQGARRLAAGLTACACAADGLIEGIELPDYPFGLAVQWHPENLQEHAPHRQLFRAFVEACSGQASV